MKSDIEKIKKEQIRKAIIGAGKDPSFLSDLKEIEEDGKYHV